MIQKRTSALLKSLIWALFLLAFMAGNAAAALAAVNVSNDALNSWGPQLVLSGADRYLVWQSATSAEDEIYFSKYSAGSWSGAINVSNNLGDSANPQMSLDGAGNLHLVWQDDTSGNYEIYYAVYNGVSWSASQNVSGDGARSTHPSITVDGVGTAYVTWQNDTAHDAEIFFSKKNGSWSAPANVSANAGRSSSPRIKADSLGRVHLVWTDESSGNARINYRRYTGGAWGATLMISSDTANSSYPAIDVDSGSDPAVVWQSIDDTGVSQIYLAAATGGGSSWPAPTQISNSALGARQPVFDEQGGDFPVIWDDERAGSQGLTFKLKRSGVWQPEINITFGSDQADGPSIAADPSGDYYLAYGLTNDSNSDVYFDNVQYGLTPVGTDKATEAGENVRLVFANVVGAGYSPAVLKIDPAGTPPAGYRFLSEFFYDISTNAGFSGEVTLTVPYDESLVFGAEAGRVRLLHRVGSAWVDITASQDTTDKTVSGETTSFSGFALAEATAAGGGPGGGGPGGGGGPATGVNQILLAFLGLGVTASGILLLRRQHLLRRVSAK